MTKNARWMTVACLVVCSACSGGSSGAGAGLPDGGVGAPAADGGTSSQNGAGNGAGDAGGTAGNGVGKGGPGAADGGVLGTTDPSWVVPKDLQLCGGPCACSDGIDNDGDGLADGFDTECTGPNDNDEGSFATGIPGDNVDPKWQDCFFDGNSGGGDDGCRYSTKCLTGELPLTDKACATSQQCINYCRPLTPNGCDCFGCCDVRDQKTGTTFHVMLTKSCQSDDLAACQQCVPNTKCVNTCGECELCPGKTPADLPASCAAMPPTAGTGGSAGSSGGAGSSGSAGTSGGAGTSGAAGSGGSTPPSYTCDSGETVCASNAGCPGGQYCSFGCCLPIPPI